jgi:hypothetical protein
MFNQIGRQILAKTVGFDLVPVKPISSPSVGIMYMDFKYDSDPNIKRKKLRKNRKDKFKELFQDE